jgi:hypothetical protein
MISYTKPVYASPNDRCWITILRMGGWGRRPTCFAWNEL